MQVLHYVISRQMKFRNEDPSELWFCINGTPIRFSRFEFVLVTGLRFGGTSFTPYRRHAMPIDSFYTRVLNNKRILVSDLRDRFIAKDLGLLTEDYVKVAKILFVYNVLFGVEKSKPKHISEWLWVLIEDETTWESFPWGSYAFQKLLHFLKSIKKTTSSGTAKRESYTLFGFSTAFMAWIYCAIPEFGSTIGVVSSTTKIPRMLRFRYTRGNIDVADVKDEVYPKLGPNDEERK
ncbi:uncharacterized protein LOC131007805 [Salvia miltiorrhiza]|uniref:uncharacterized protein LOC131007805 n=1 Tax=Salvia miltiorrhiza TaxID=226208 RepID=UPI0025ABE350|nr:uncharacterized protein LOC131007805 [Salvia miltiorrhiza]